MRDIKGRLLLCLLSIFLVCPEAYSKPIISDSKVSFVSTANPGLITIEGVGGKFEDVVLVIAKDGKLTGNFKVKLDAFDTGINLRNEHMRDKYLEVKKYPLAEFSFKNQPDSGVLKGIMKIKKDSKEMEFKYELKDGHVTAKGFLNVKDFPSIGVPSYLGVTAADRVDISVEFKLK